MWPFKKKVLQQDITPKTFETLICIPGTWDNWDEFILSIVEATNGEYLAAGNILMNAKNERYYTIEFCNRDEKMKESFSYAGKVTRVTDSFLAEIGNHKHVIYISGSTGNLEDAGHIAFAAEAVLKAGGLGIKIETAGKAFEKSAWLHFTNNFQESYLYEMFVIDSIYQQNGTTFSCGMQNLGLKDTIVSDLPFQEAVDLIRIFGYYQLVDKPTILPNQTFTPISNSPLYRITEEHNPPYKESKLFGNPFGTWRLSRE
jgi:hypothetical protein